MSAALFDGWEGVARVLVVGTIAYVALVVLLRVTGKRTLSKMNAFDLVVTVALQYCACHDDTLEVYGACGRRFRPGYTGPAAVRGNVVRRAFRNLPSGYQGSTHAAHAQGKVSARRNVS